MTNGFFVILDSHNMIASSIQKRYDGIHMKNGFLFGIFLLLLTHTVSADRLIILNQSKLTALPQIYRQAQHGLQLQAPNFLVPLTDMTATTRHRHYQQYIHGIPLWGKRVIQHERLENSQKRTFLSGELLQLGSGPIFLPPPQNSISAKTALAICQKIFQKKFPFDWHYQDITKKLVYYFDDEQQAHLAYAIRFLAQTPEQAPQRPYFIIDAHNQEILLQFNSLTYEKVGLGPGGNSKPTLLGGLGRYEYGTDDHPALDITQAGDLCLLENPDVITLDNMHGMNKAHIVLFNCFRHDDDETNGAASPANDAHFFAGVTSHMFQDWYHIRPLQQRISIFVHYLKNWDNAMWDGHQIKIGDGNDLFYPLSSLEIIAHEIAHGFTEQHSHLIYHGEPGGLNESFSDMAAKATHFYLYGHVHWHIGVEILKALNDQPIRDMQYPNRDGYSFSDIRQYQGVAHWPMSTEEKNARLDPHFTSGIFNRLFYLIATTPGWDPHQAFDVMLDANRHYWTPTTTFLQAAWGIVQATKDRRYPLADVLLALHEIGIECSLRHCDIAGTKNSSTPVTLQMARF